MARANFIATVIFVMVLALTVATGFGIWKIHEIGWQLGGEQPELWQNILIRAGTVAFWTVPVYAFFGPLYFSLIGSSAVAAVTTRLFGR